MGKNFPHDVDTTNRDQPTDVKALRKHTPKKEIPQSPHPFNVTIEDLVKTNNHRQAGERGVSVSGKFSNHSSFLRSWSLFQCFDSEFSREHMPNRKRAREGAGKTINN